MRVVFVYPNPRAELIAHVVSGDAPDTNLLGQNHLADHGIEAVVRDSFLRRRPSSGGVGDRLRWHARELTLPFEVGRADLLVTPLHTLLPLAARLRRRPRVVLLSYGVVSTWRRAGSARRRLLRAALRATSAVVAVSEAGRERLLADAELPADHVKVALLGVDTDWWRPASSRPDGYVLTVGRDLARDYTTFARALEGLDVHGVILCKRENLRGVTLPSNVEVRLDVPPTEVRALYAGSSCVVVPTVADVDPRGTENSGTISLLEAMASGRPTVATERVYLRDYLDPAATIVTPPGNAAALRDAILRVTGDGQLARSMGEAGRTRAVSHHSTRTFAARLAGVLREAV